MDTHVLMLLNIQGVILNGHTCINVIKYPGSHYKWTHIKYPVSQYKWTHMY